MGTQQSDLMPPPFLHCREGSFFPGLVPHGDMVDSVSAVIR